MRSSSLGILCASIVFFPKQGSRAVDEVDASRNECHDIFASSNSMPERLFQAAKPESWKCLLNFTSATSGCLFKRSIEKNMVACLNGGGDLAFLYVVLIFENSLFGSLNSQYKRSSFSVNYGKTQDIFHESEASLQMQILYEFYIVFRITNRVRKEHHNIPEYQEPLRQMDGKLILSRSLETKQFQVLNYTPPMDTHFSGQCNATMN
uniref:Uncharacterized protein n=1 Tax=Glossina austeni TaxID=7395 RepID=A0A1A9VTY8_GLOAU